MTTISSIDPIRWPSLANLSGQGSRLRSAATRSITARLFEHAVANLPVLVHWPDGRTSGAGGSTVPQMHVHRPTSFLTRLGTDGLIGFGESYMAGDWDADDLGGFLTELSRHIATLVPAPLQKLRGLYVARHPGNEENTQANTRRNISRHYDLSNDLFAAFLDETMTYSSALFDVPAGAGLDAFAAQTQDDLATAQRRKIDRLLDQAAVSTGSRVLEIGTGWGELCLRAASRGAEVRSVTLSSEQQHLAQQRIAAAGFSDQVQVDLLDYRAVAGEYDAIVSVEMIEAVGMAYWPTYFQTIDRLLAPGGRVAIQAITMPHERMLATRSTYTWVHKYIFPGGFLPSIRAITEITNEQTTLRVQDNLSMGLHYAHTLDLWDQRFRSVLPHVADLGFDKVFERMWHFYLEYSRAGFASRYLDVNQLTLAREEA